MHCHTHHTMSLTMHCHIWHIVTTHCQSQYIFTYNTLHSPYNVIHHTLSLITHCHSQHIFNQHTLSINTHVHWQHIAIYHSGERSLPIHFNDVWLNSSVNIVQIQCPAPLPKYVMNHVTTTMIISLLQIWFTQCTNPGRYSISVRSFSAQSVEFTHMHSQSNEPCVLHHLAILLPPHSIGERKASFRKHKYITK